MNTSMTPLKFGYRILYYIIMFGIFFQFFAYPVYAMVEYFPYGAKSKYYIHYERPDDYLNSETDESRERKETPNRSVVANPKRVTKSHTISKSSIATSTKETAIEIFSQDKSGIIGYGNNSNSDDPSDNIFSFNIEKQILTGKEIRLSYEVYGIENVSGISRSINENNATGGYLVRKNSQWNRLEETISLNQLKNGVNHLMFTAFENKNADYKIKNVSIKAVPVEKHKLIAIADGATVYTKNNKAYIKGSVMVPGFDLYVNNEKIAVKNNEFETVVAHAAGTTQLEVQLKKQDALIYSEQIQLTESGDAAVHTFKNAESYSLIKQLDDKSYGFKLEDVGFNIQKESYDKVEQITVQKLRAIDLAPLGTNIINVTQNKTGYRFLPEGAKFKDQAQVTIKFDISLLPGGYNAEDVKILYFDLDQRRWLSVPTDTIITDQNKVVGLTDHFTDYIAGIIQSPESPETSSFTPTSISDIQVANPTANIVQIQPPTANQKGDGTLEFPITVPAGRNGIQPNLSVSYNNNGTSGMVGYGWDIAIPYITVDTKFGVPKYDNNLESESYLLNGEELMLKNNNDLYLPHRSANLINRVNNAVFVPKVEGSFSKIQRMGNSPSSYYWVIWDKSGTKYTYINQLAGGTAGRIAKWHLYEVRDKNNNYMTYNYMTETYSQGNLSGGKEMIPHSIHYTYNDNFYPTPNDEKLNYRVEFIYKDGIRADATFNYRYGFKEVNGMVLDYIRVTCDKKAGEPNQTSSPVKTYATVPYPVSVHCNYDVEYHFNYGTGRFGKRMLDGITTRNIQKDNAGNITATEDYTHTFDYYNDMGSELFGPAKTIDVPDDFADEKHSVLNSTQESYQTHEVNIGAGISPSTNPPAWWPFSYGGTFNFAFPSNTSTKGSPDVLLLDIDGDGLDDKVMKIGNDIRYRKNIGGIAFSETLYRAHNISDLGLSESNTKPGSEFSVTIIGGNFNASESTTNSRVRTFLTDVNGDGLVDYVKDKIVYFNRIDPNSGLPTFTDNSELTPNIIYKENAVDATISPPLPNLQLENDLMDVVKVWVAPRKGTVHITGNISKNFVASHNGVRYSIEKSGEVLRPYFWDANYPVSRIDFKLPIVSWDPNQIPIAGPVIFDPYNGSYVKEPTLLVKAEQDASATADVEAGDYLFFRVNSSQVPEDLVDVTWDPVVTYDDGNYSSQYSKAFLYGDVVAETLTLTEPGNYRIKWDNFNVSLKEDLEIKVKAYRFEKNPNTDVLEKKPIIGSNIVVGTYKVGKSNTSLNNPNINFTLSNTGLNPIDPIDPNTYRYVEIEVSGKFSVDWKAFDNVFVPKLENITANESKHIVPQYDMRDNFLTQYGPIKFPVLTPIQIKNNFVLDGCQLDGGCESGYIYMIARYEDSDEPVIATNTGLPVKFRYLVREDGSIGEARQFEGESFDSSPVMSQPFIDIDARPDRNLVVEYTADTYHLASALNNYQNNYELILTGSAGFASGSAPINSGAVPAGNMGTPMNLNGTYIPIAGMPANLKRANISTKTAKEMGVGTLYKDWGQFAYKGAAPDQNFTFIKKSYISRKALAGVSSMTDSTKITQEEYNKMNDLMNKDLDSLDYDFDEGTLKSSGVKVGINQNQLEAMKHFTILRSDRANQAWSSHERLYVKAEEMSPYLRFYNDSYVPMLPIPAPTGVNTYGAFSIVKEAVSESQSKGRSVSFFGFSVGSSDSEGTSRQLNDFMDVNGDGYPDIIGDKIQVTSRRGGLTNDIRNKNLLGTTLNKGSGETAGGSSAHIIATADPSGRFTQVKVGNNSTFAGSLSIGANTFTTTSTPENALIDLNGDGLVDLVKRDGVVEFNTATDFVVSSWPDYGQYPIQSKTKSLSLNGSFGLGYSELNQTLFNGMLSNGKNSSNLDLSYGLSGSRSATRNEKDFVDFNGDGLPDLISNGTVHFNTGTGHNGPSASLDRMQESSSITHGQNANASVLISIPITIFGVGIIIKVGGGGGKSWIKSYNGDNVSFRDFDGDGYVDMVESVSETQVKVRYSNIGRTNMLKKVHNPTGSVIELDYATHNKQSGTGFGSTYKMPFKKWVLSKVEVNDGFQGDGEDIQQYSFEYQNGLKDRRERKFLGFGEVKTHQLKSNGSVYRTNVQEYVLNDMTQQEIYLKGTSSDSRKYQYIGSMLKRQSTFDGMQRLLSTTEYDHAIYSLGATNPTSEYQTEYPISPFTYTDTSRILPLVKSTVDSVFHYNGTAASPFKVDVVKSLIKEYDKYGNVTRYYDNLDATNVQISYHELNSATQYVVNVPATHSVNNLERYSSTGIDAKGNITSINRHKDGVPTGGDIATTNLEYDNLGNLTKVIQPKPQMSSNNSERMFYEYVYDDAFKTFVKSVTDAYGHTSSTTYDHFGMPLIQRDINGIQFAYVYDPMRRIIQFKGPYSNEWTIRNEYKKVPNSDLRYAVTKHNIMDEIVTPGEQILHTSSFADGLGRIIQTKKQLAIEDDPNCTTPGNGYRFSTSGMQVYDEFGRVKESYLGQEELNCAGVFVDALESYTALTHVVQEKTSISYDMRDRVLQNHVHGLNATTTYEYGFENDGWSGIRAFEKIVLPEGNTSITYKDEKGRVTATKQKDGGTELLTKYWYDPLSQLKRVTDAEGKETFYEYDRFGQKTQTLHPDNGLSQFTYDLTGKLTASTNQNLINNSQQISYTYNFNQLMAITYPSHVVSYTYGGVLAPDFAAGRITEINDLTGTKTMKYGKLGEVVEDKRLLVSANAQQLQFTTAYRYDSWGRMMELTYPDGEHLTYGYNSVGQLKNIINDTGEEYLTDVTYNFFDQPVRIEYGNEVVTTNEYDITQRIRAMQLDRPDTSTFMNNVYTYDKNQNITNITNNISQHAVLQLGGVSNKSYTYDKFNRLKAANGTWQGGLNEAHNYTLDMTYNNTHGIVHKNQYHNKVDPSSSGETENSYDAAYKYDDVNHPHAVSSIVYSGIAGTQSALSEFTYDANGNMTTYQTNHGPFTDRQMIWDEQNRLMAVIDDNTTASHYVYDHAGERTFKFSGNISQVNIGGSAVYSVLDFDNYVIYPSGYIVADNSKDEYSKHYYINGKRFVSRLENDLSQFVPPAGKGAYGVSANESMEMQNDGLDLQTVMGVQNTTYSIIIDNDPQDCADQMDAIILAYQNINNPPTASVQHCINAFQGMVEKANDPNFPDYDICEALKEANQYICRPINVNEQENDPDDTTAPGYTQGEIDEFDCLTELNLLTAQYAAAVGAQLDQQLMELFSIPECGRSAAGHCCQNYMLTGVWDCPECPDMTLEDCNLGGNHENPEEQWLECMTECLNNSDNPGYGIGCLEHFLDTGEWYEDCMYWTIECDCDEKLTVTPPEEPIIECMRNCGVEGVEGCVERYDADGTWTKECNDLITECECENVEGPEEPGPGEPPIDTEMMNCARDCENSSAYACWEYFHVTGEWMPGCKDIMRDCGCYDSDNEQDCYRKALSYIKNELVLEPESNACVVLEYVKTHFKCIAAITPEDDPEDHDDTDDDWVDGGGNTTSPGTDGPYDETKRKPIWWYHTDHLGSSTYLTDNFGRPSHYYETLPFGEMMVEHNQSASVPSGIGYDNKYKFNGKELDDATGMYYYGARYYDPRISIFVSVDPLAEEFVGWTPYHYVHQNPINLIDPTGMSAEWIDNGDGTWTAEEGDSAATLAKDAGISYERANELVQSQLGSNYVDIDGIEKSNVEIGDMVIIPEQVQAISIQSANEDFNRRVDNQVKEIDNKINSLSKEIKDSHNKHQALESAEKFDRIWIDRMEGGVAGRTAGTARLQHMYARDSVNKSKERTSSEQEKEKLLESKKQTKQTKQIKIFKP